MIKNLLMAVVAAVFVTALLFWWFNMPSPASAPVTAETLELMGKLNTAKIDSSFFSDPAFSNLELDPGPSPESSGGPNPFKPRR